jgi:hypothetical protein
LILLTDLKISCNHYTSIRVAKTETSNDDEDMEQQELSFIAGRKPKWYGYFRR